MAFGLAFVFEAKLARELFGAFGAFHFDDARANGGSYKDKAETANDHFWQLNMVKLG